MNGILHSDIKPPNILWRKSGDSEYHYYLADFGISKFYGFPVPILDYQTTYYFGPHINYEGRDKRFDNIITINLDVYSLGLVFLYLRYRITRRKRIKYSKLCNI